MHKLCLILVCALSVIAENPEPLPTEIKLVTMVDKQDSSSINAANWFFSKTVANLSQNLELNFNVDETVVVTKAAAADWGLDCKPENDCNIGGGAEQPGKYYGKDYKYQDGTVVIRPTTETFKSPQTPALAARLVINAPGPLDPRQWGVLGMSPSSAFATYVRALYIQPFNILIKYTRDTKVADPVTYNLEATIGSKHDGVSVYDTITLDKDVKHWLFNAAVQLGGTVPPTPSLVKTCLTHFGNEVAYMANAGDICTQAYKAICGDKTGADCKVTTDNLKKGTDLIFSINGKTYKLKPEQYIRGAADTNQAICRLGPLTDVMTNSGCDATSALILSKGFIEVFPTVLTYTNTAGVAGATIQFLGDGGDSGNGSTSPIWIILLIIAAIIAVGVLVYIFFFKKKDGHDAEVNYVSV